MARKKKQPEHVNHERWMVSYADFVTLLFAFFVVLFAASQTDQAKAGQVSKSIERAFNRYYIFKTSGEGGVLGGVVGLDIPEYFPLLPAEKIIDKKDLSEFTNPKFQVPKNEEGENTVNYVFFGELKEAENIEEASSILGDMINRANLNDAVKIKKTSQGMKLTAQDTVLFEEGNDSLTATGSELIDRIGNVVNKLPNYIMIEGFTDNVPISGSRFKDNMALSQSRAEYVRDRLVKYNKIDSEKLITVGRGELYPIAPNDTAQDRGKNRRVEITLMKSPGEETEHKKEKNSIP